MGSSCIGLRTIKKTALSINHLLELLKIKNYCLAVFCCLASSQQNGSKQQTKTHQMDWFQQVGSICLIFYTKTSGPSVSEYIVHVKQPVILLRVKREWYK